MDRIRKLVAPRASYEPLRNDESNIGRREGARMTAEGDERPKTPFSWMTYSVFVLLGVAMLWAWYVRMSRSHPFQSVDLQITRVNRSINQSHWSD